MLQALSSSFGTIKKEEKIQNMTLWKLNHTQLGILVHTLVPELGRQIVEFKTSLVTCTVEQKSVSSLENNLVYLAVALELQ